MVAGAQSLTKLNYGIRQSLVEKDAIKKGIVTNQSYLETYESKLPFALIIPLLMAAALSIERFLKKRAK